MGGVRQRWIGRRDVRALILRLRDAGTTGTTGTTAYSYTCPRNTFKTINGGTSWGAVNTGLQTTWARSLAVNPPAYDPSYHFRLALDAGCNAYAAPLGSLEASAAKFAGQVPLILKVNGKTDVPPSDSALSTTNASVEDAVRLGADAVGYTLYVGSPRQDADSDPRDLPPISIYATIWLLYSGNCSVATCWRRPSWNFPPRRPPPVHPRRTGSSCL